MFSNSANGCFKCSSCWLRCVISVPRSYWWGWIQPHRGGLAALWLSSWVTSRELLQKPDGSGKHPGCPAGTGKNTAFSQKHVGSWWAGKSVDSDRVTPSITAGLSNRSTNSPSDAKTMDLKHKMECFTNGIYFMCPTGNKLENIWNREAHWKVTGQHICLSHSSGSMGFHHYQWSQLVTMLGFPLVQWATPIHI